MQYICPELKSHVSDQFGPFVESYNAFNTRESGFKLGAFDMVGDDDGDNVGIVVGKLDVVGEDEGVNVRVLVGKSVGLKLGVLDGNKLGFFVGNFDVVGDDEGLKLGILVGIIEGKGLKLGTIVGIIEGNDDGKTNTGSLPFLSFNTKNVKVTVTATAMMTTIQNINSARRSLYHGIDLSSTGKSSTLIASTITFVSKMFLSSSTSVATMTSPLYRSLPCEDSTGIISCSGNEDSLSSSTPFDCCESDMLTLCDTATLCDCCASDVSDLCDAAIKSGKKLCSELSNGVTTGVLIIRSSSNPFVAKSSEDKVLLPVETFSHRLCSCAADSFTNEYERFPAA